MTRRSNLRLATGCAAALASAGSASAANFGANSASLAREGNWIVNYDDDSCQIAAAFGTGDQAIVARFARFQPGDGFDLALIGKPVELPRGAAPVKFSFGIAALPIEREVATGTANGKPMILLGSHTFAAGPGRMVTLTAKGSKSVKPLPYAAPSAVTPQLEAQIRSLTVELGSRSYRLELGSMAAPMAAMRTCLDDLLRHWGYDPATAKTMSRGPVPTGNPGNWVTTKDYPSGALMDGSSGIVQFRADVDEAGKVVRCSVLYRTNPDEFGDRTCRLIASRARFKPAIDAAGKPIKWFYISKVRWMTPR